MAMEISYPKLRNIDVFPAEVSGQKIICLRDPLHLAEKIFFIPYSLLSLIRLFDGRHSIIDIQVECMRQYGELIYKEKIQELVDQLEEFFLLDSERFRQVEGKIIETFKNSPTRPMALAGETYEKDPDPLRHSIRTYFTEPEGPGGSAAPKPDGRLAGAIAPHIDFRRGGFCYAWTHKAIQDLSDAQQFMILGTAHSATKQPFALTRKDFETPWGIVETNRSFLKKIEPLCSFDVYEDEFVHKGEHSIELQLIFLRALWDRPEPFRIIPVLCGSFHEAILHDVSPLELPGVRSFLAAMKGAIAQSPEKICVLASADLAHMGQKFGDADAPNRFTLESLEEDDRSLLAHAERIDAEGFYECLRREKDRRRICGFPPIYTLLHLLGAREGKILKYGQSLDPATQSVVTFASVAFFS
jgi:MEMO1 family protein